MVETASEINQRDAEKKRLGYWEFYFLNGNLIWTGYYEKDKRSGYWEDYGLDGNLNWTGHYDGKGLRVGCWEFYNKDGSLTHKTFYGRNYE